MRTLALAAVLLTGLALSGCAGQQSATAALYATTAKGVGSVQEGSVLATQSNAGLTITISVSAGSGLAPGLHGVHVHNGQACGPGPASATNSTVVAAGAAGPHFNPDGLHHGHHAGDLGNILIAADGSGQLVATPADQTAPLTLSAGQFSIQGHAVVIHAKADDLATDPSGNSGGRVLCGVLA